MSILKVSTDVDNFMQSADNTAMRTALELGASDTVEFGALEISEINFPNLTTSELNAVTNATEGDTYFDSDRGQFVRFTGAASYDVITSRSYEPTLKTTQGAALTLPATRLFESGVLAGSPDVFNPTDVLLVFSGKNPQSATPTSYFYHTGEQGPAGWYNAGNPAAGLITAEVFTPNSLMQLRLAGVSTPFMSGDYIINTVTPVNLASAVLKAGSTYSFELNLGAVDLLGSNVSITVDYSGLLEESGLLSLVNTDVGAKSDLFDININAPDMPTKVVIAAGGFAGVAGSTLGSWVVSGILTPSSDGTLTIDINQNSASVEPLFFSAPTMFVTLLSD